MKKLLYFFKKIIAIILKMVVAVLIGLDMSFGKKQITMEKKDNNSIGVKK